MALFTGAGDLILAGDYERVYDCRFDGPAVILDGANYSHISNCAIFNGTGNTAIGVSGFGHSGHDVTITNNFIDGDVVIGQDGGGTGNWMIFNDNHVQGNVAIYRYNAVVVADNTILGDGAVDTDHVLIKECTIVTVTGNVFHDDEDTNTLHIIGDTGSAQEGVVVANNSFGDCQGSILIEDCPYSMVTGNFYGPHIGGGFERAVVVVNSDDCLIEGNSIKTFYDSSLDNTLDIIQVNGDRNMVTANKLVPDAIGGDPRYGINVVSGNDNVVVGNDLRGGPYGTAPIGDSGTGTILTYPGGTYGDNFT